MWTALMDRSLETLPLPALRQRWKQSTRDWWQQSGILQPWVDFLLREMDPLLSRRALSARVVSVRQESADCRSLVLRPARAWKGFTAGMHLPITVELNGRRVTRFYSISSTPLDFAADGTITITVKRVPGGQVSTAIVDRAYPGQILGIGAARGDFVLDPQGQGPLLMLAGGSGITPMRSMLLHDVPRHPDRDVVLIHHCRTASDVVFGEDFRALAAQYDHFHYQPVHTDTDGLLTAEALAASCPDIAQREIYLCGPSGFMDVARDAFTRLGCPAERVHQELFGFAPMAPNPAAGEQAEAPVRFLLSDRIVTTAGEYSLLELAEQAGLSPKYGCRSGICHECACRKERGVVRNRVTGQLSTDGPETIQSCLSMPVGAVEVAL